MPAFLKIIIIHKFTECFLIDYDRLMRPKSNKTTARLCRKLAVARMVSKCH